MENSTSTRWLDGRTAPVPRLWIRSAEALGGGWASLGEWEHNNNSTRWIKISAHLRQQGRRLLS